MDATHRARAWLGVAWLAMVSVPVSVSVSCNPRFPCRSAPSLTTGSEVRFAALGDTGTGSAEQRRVGAALRAKCLADGCDFVALLGDNFLPSGVEGSEDPQWQSKFEVPYAGIDVPFYAALGNHDYGDGSLEAGRALAQLAYGEVSDRWRMPAACYAFEAGPAALVALDTQLLSVDYRGAVQQQGAYAAKALRESSAPWKIVFGHHPYRSNGSHGDAGRYDGQTWPPMASGQYVREVFDRYLCETVDLYLCGHDHNRQFFADSGPCGFATVVSGAGGKTTPLARDGGASFQSSGLGFAYVVATDQTLRVEMLDGDGRVDYAWSKDR